MRVIDIAATANANLKRSKLRTFLTLLAIGIGTFTLSLSLGLGEGVKNYISSQLGSFEDVNLYRIVKLQDGGLPSGGFGNSEPTEYTGESSNFADFTQLFLSPEDIKSIEEVKGVEKSIKPWSPSFEYFINSDGKKISASTEITLQEIPLNLVAGNSIKDEDINKILLSRKYVSSIGASSSEDAIGETITLYYKVFDGTLNSKDFVVNGVFEPTLIDQPIKINSTDAEEVARSQSQFSEPTFITIFVTKSPDVSDETFRQGFTDAKFDARSLAEINNTLNSIVTGVQVALAAFSAIAILASVVGVINTLFMAVLERTREIGLFRALGAKPKTVFTLFAFEAALLGFWGSAFGLFFAYLFQLGINTIARNTFLQGIEGFQLLAITPQMAVGIVMIIAMITFLAGIIPAVKASRLDPIEALRYE